MINTLKKLFRRINCRHESQKFLRNIYGEEILYAEARSIWKCDRCDKYFYKPDLHKSGWSLFDFFASEHNLHFTESQLDDITAAACSREGFTYYSDQKTSCAGCGRIRHTPIRNDVMGGYVCLTCIDRELIRLQSREVESKTPMVDGGVE